MNKLLIALGMTLAASTAALADSSALDVATFPAAISSAASEAPVTGDIDYTATASIGEASDDQFTTYDRGGLDVAPRVN
ncbi:MAG: hypothetical protein RID59_16075 [Hoeflea sp.]|jgi:hypothetical protein